MSISPFKRQWVAHIRNAHPRPTTEGELHIVLVSVEEGCAICERFDILSELDFEPENETVEGAE